MGKAGEDCFFLKRECNGMGTMIDLLLIIVIVILCIIRRPPRSRRRKSYPPSYDYLYRRSSKGESWEGPSSREAPVEAPLEQETLPVKGAYRRSWVFTQNEKAEYRKLKSMAEELGYVVLAKVRLLDLLEPKQGIPKYKTYFYKVQAKHIDFVLCDQEKLVARILIELDDNSHDQPHRMERDRFVDEVVQSVGYKIIHTRRISQETREQLLKLKGMAEPEEKRPEGPQAGDSGTEQKSEEI